VGPAPYFSTTPVRSVGRPFVSVSQFSILIFNIFNRNRSHFVFLKPNFPMDSEQFSNKNVYLNSRKMCLNYLKLVNSIYGGSGLPDRPFFLISPIPFCVYFRSMVDLWLRGCLTDFLKRVSYFSYLLPCRACYNSSSKLISNRFAYSLACSFGLSATRQQYFSLRTNQPPTISQQYFSLRTNQHQPSATSQTNRLHICSSFSNN
jgi:hypothetical protein